MQARHARHMHAGNMQGPQACMQAAGNRGGGGVVPSVGGWPSDFACHTLLWVAGKAPAASHALLWAHPLVTPTPQVLPLQACCLVCSPPGHAYPTGAAPDPGECGGQQHWGCAHLTVCGQVRAATSTAVHWGVMSTAQCHPIWGGGGGDSIVMAAGLTPACCQPALMPSLPPSLPPRQ